VVHLPTDVVLDVLFFVNTDDTLILYIYIYGYTFLGSLWCSHVLMFFSAF
jgi:hypothetical protein